MAIGIPKDAGTGERTGNECKAILLFLCPEIPVSDDHLMTQFCLLESLLCKGNSSPMYKALVKSHLRAALFACGHSQEQLNSTMGIGISGASEESAQSLESVVIETIKQVVAEGIGSVRLEGLMRELELHDRKGRGEIAS
jgi:Zn-dependent M16 (insulinase) family peptidase